MDVQLQQIEGIWVLGSSDLCPCKLQYHKPYLAIVDENKQFQFVSRIPITKNAKITWYYNVENIKTNDLVMIAGGIGKDKEPFRGRVHAIDLAQGVLRVEEVVQPLFHHYVQRQVVAKTLQPLLSELKGKQIPLHRVRGLSFDMPMQEYGELLDSLVQASADHSQQ